MEKLKCPLCKESVVVAVDRAAWFESRGPVILAHMPGPAAVLNRRDVKHPGSFQCLASGCSVALAEGIAEDRRAGVHLRPHP